MPTYANIGGTRKTIGSWYNNIGGTRKTINTMYGNVGGSSKIIYESGTDYWSIPKNTSGTLSSSTSYSRMASTSVTVNSSGTFTLQSAASQKGRPAAGTFMVKVNNGSSTTTTGTVLYYFYNSSGGYYAFDTNISNTSSTAVSRVTSSTYNTDVAYDTSTNKLLLKRSLVPNYYRWDYYENTTSYVLKNRGYGGSAKLWLYEYDDGEGNNPVDNDEYYYADNVIIRGNSNYSYADVGSDNYGYISSAYHQYGSGLAGSAAGNYQKFRTYGSYNTIEGIPPDDVLKNTRWTRWVDGSDPNGITQYYATLTWDDSYYADSDYSLSHTGYVYSPNSSQYTVDSIYKNKTTL